MIRPTWVAAAAATGLLAFTASTANAATLSVDDDGDECPAAAYTSVQDAIDDSNAGDVITICDGTYTEGTGAAGTSPVQITHDLDIRGMGADGVFIQPKRSTPNGGQIAAGSPVIRDGVGNIVSITGGSNFPITVNISGVTVRGNGVYSEVGVMFLDAQGSLKRSRVTDIVTSEASGAFQQPGGFRSNNVGMGVVHATTATSAPPANPPRVLTIDNSRIDRYNKIGVLEDAATNDTPPLTSSGVDNRLVMTQSHVIGRIKCQNFPQDGNCSNPAQLTTGPLFGQDGVRVTAGARATLDGVLISQNGISGAGFPTRSTFNGACTVLTPVATNNNNLTLGSGVRLIGAATSVVTDSNLVDNAYAVNNLELDGTTANTATMVSAENNWWGQNLCRGSVVATPLTGPAISPTANPPLHENPVNGTAVADPTCTLAPSQNSTAVDICPHRVGPQSDPNNGEWTVNATPIPVDDAAPTVDLSSDTDEYDRGDTVTLTADAEDDFGVSEVRFFDGANPIDTLETPPYELGFVIPSNAPCGSRTFSAVVTDSFGQTSSDDVVIDVVGPNNCEDPPEAPDIQFNAPPSTIPQGGITVQAVPDAPEGVDNVEFFLGTRSVCTDTSDPYTCLVVPQGDEVGLQTLRAVVTDDAAQTAQVAVPVTVDKFTPDGISIHMAKTRLTKKKVSRTISGVVDLPNNVTAEDGCDGGAVTLEVLRNNLTLFPSSVVALQDDCSYSLSFTLKEKKGKSFNYIVDATFSGNDVLKPISDSEGFN